MNLNRTFTHIVGITSMFIAAQQSWAQTNTAVSFQGYPMGAIVRVRSEQPLVLLNRATLNEITPSNIVVVAKGDRFVLRKSGTVLSDLEPQFSGPEPATSAGGTKSVSASASARPAIAPVNNTVAGVQEMVLGRYAGDPGYANAKAQYQSDMADYSSGKLSLNGIVEKAENVLAELDKYQPERAADPQYESQIAVLRNFVQRAKAGEQVEPTRPE